MSKSVFSSGIFKSEVTKQVVLHVYAVPGDRVKIPELEQMAVVRSVTVNQGGTIQYEVCYFANGERKSVYLFGDEFAPCGDSK